LIITDRCVGAGLKLKWEEALHRQDWAPQYNASAGIKPRFHRRIFLQELGTLGW